MARRSAILAAFEFVHPLAEEVKFTGTWQEFLEIMDHNPNTYLKTKRGRTRVFLWHEVPGDDWFINVAWLTKFNKSIEKAPMYVKKDMEHILDTMFRQGFEMYRLMIPENTES